MAFGAAVQRKANWNERIARAATLAQSVPAAAEILGVYEQLAKFQRALYDFLENCSYVSPAEAASLPELDWFFLLPRFEPLLHLLQAAASEPLRESVRELQAAGPARWQQILLRYWRNDQLGSDADELVARAFLQPVAEYLANQSDFSSSQVRRQCPFCGRPPVVAALRPEGDGAKRSLICSLCSTEWQFRRILCPACGEERLEHLPVYTAEEFPQVRIEACDTCKQYIKAVDLTKNGLAVPVVDELATLPLNLWAEEKGYRKIQPNLFGL